MRRLGRADRAGGVEQAAFALVGEHLHRGEVGGDHVVADLLQSSPRAPPRPCRPPSAGAASPRAHPARAASGSITSGIAPKRGLVDEGEVGDVAEVLDHHAEPDRQLERRAVAPRPLLGVEPRQGWAAPSTAPPASSKPVPTARAPERRGYGLPAGSGPGRAATGSECRRHLGRPTPSRGRGTGLPRP